MSASTTQSGSAITSGRGRRLAGWLHARPRMQLRLLLLAPLAWMILVYLGSLRPDRERVAGISALETKLAAPDAPTSSPGSLFEVDGSLVPLPRRSCPEGCPAESPFLVDKLANVSELMSTSGIPVEVDSGTPEVDVDAAVVQGTFLVGRVDDGGGWRIVARYLPERSFRVLAP